MILVFTLSLCLFVNLCSKYIQSSVHLFLNKLRGDGWNSNLCTVVNVNFMHGDIHGANIVYGKRLHDEFRSTDVTEMWNMPRVVWTICFSNTTSQHCSVSRTKLFCVHNHLVMYACCFGACVQSCRCNWHQRGLLCWCHTLTMSCGNSARIVPKKLSGQAFAQEFVG